MKQRNLLAACLALLVCVLFLWRYSASQAPGNRSDAVVQPSEDSNDTAWLRQEPEPDAPSSRTSPARNTPPTRALLRVRAIEQGSRIPVRAALTLPKPQHASTLPTQLFADADGRLLIPNSPNLAPNLALSARGYESSQVDTQRLRQSEESELVVELIPNLQARVRVISDHGVPIAGVALDWIPATNLGDARDATPFESQTGADGIGQVASASSLWASASGERGAISQRVLVEPGGPLVELVVGGSTHTLVFLDSGSGAPASGVSLQVRQSASGDMLGHPVVTDAQGEVSLLGFRPPLVLEFQRDVNRLFAESQSSPFTHVSRNPRMLDIFGIGAPPSERIEIQLDACGYRVQCMSGTTGEPLDGPSEWRADFQVGDGSWVLGLWTAHTIVNGQANLPCFHLDHRLYMNSRLLVRPQLHATAELDRGLLLLSQDPQGPQQTAFFDPYLPRSLALKSAQGGPLPVGNLSILEADQETPVAFARTNMEGITVPFHWPGGDLLVRIDGIPTADPSEPLGLLAPNRPPTILVRVPRAELERNEVVPVLVPIRTGTIEVHGCPEDHAPLILRTSGDMELHPTKTGSTLLFQNVPCGRIIVGPEAWVAGLWQRKYYGSPAGWFQLKSSDVLELPWNPLWFSPRELTGRVQFTGELPGDPLLIPIYGPPSTRQPIGARMSQIQRNARGEYRIPSGDALPSLILICCREEARATFARGRRPLRILGDVAPGQDRTLQLKSVRLTWPADTPWDGPVEIQFQLPESRFLNPASMRIAWDNELGGFAHWRNEGPLTVQGLIGNQATLRFRSPHGSWEETIELEQPTGEHRLSPP